MRRLVLVLVTLFVVATPVAGLAGSAAGGPAADDSGLAAVESPAPAAAVDAATGTPTPNNSSQATSTPTAAPNQTATATPTPTTDPQNRTPPDNGPTLADEARVTAVKFTKPFLSVQRSGPKTWNTTGPYAVFAVSEDVEAVRVKQPKASAKVLDGGRSVKVTFKPDAAPDGKSSLYTVTVFFADGSQTTLTLYAANTEQHVASSELINAEPLLDVMKKDAKAHGYNTTVDGMIAYHKWERDQADLLNNLFSEQLARFLGWLIVTAKTPAAIVVLLSFAGLVLRRFIKTHEWKLRSQLAGGNSTQDARRRLIEQYRRDRISAAEHDLEDLPEVGHDWIHWQEVYGVSTVKQLADLFAEGRPRRDAQGNLVRHDPSDEDVEPVTDARGGVVTGEDGEPLGPPKFAHRGVEDLIDADSLQSTWLEPITRTEHLNGADSALAHAKAALRTICTEYGQAEYDRARAQTRELQEAVVNEQSTRAQTVSTRIGGTAASSTSATTSTAGGDD